MRKPFVIGQAVRSKGHVWTTGQVIGFSFARDRYRVLAGDREFWVAESSMGRAEPIMTNDELMDEAAFMLSQGEHPHMLPTILRRSWEVLLRVAKKTGRLDVLEQLVAASDAERVRKRTA